MMRGNANAEGDMKTATFFKAIGELHDVRAFWRLVKQVRGLRYPRASRVTPKRLQLLGTCIRPLIAKYGNRIVGDEHAVVIVQDILLTSSGRLVSAETKDDLPLFPVMTFVNFLDWLLGSLLHMAESLAATREDETAVIEVVVWTTRLTDALIVLGEYRSAEALLDTAG